MGLKPVYKQTVVGLIPEDWDVRTLGDGIELLSGHHVLAQHCSSRDQGVPYLTGPADFVKGAIRNTKYTVRPTTLCKPDDILVTVKGSGSGTVVVADAVYCISRQLMAIRVHEWDKRFIYYSLLQNASQIKAASTGLIPGLSRSDILEQALPLPQLPEQRAIAGALSDVDVLIGVLDRLIAKKRDLKQATMQQLLTGKQRLPGFSAKWEAKKIAEIATHCSEKNIAAEALPVLTCSKHFGFVDSLGYFKNQVFSKDTSTYKLIRRGQIGYPSNHVEEGSIGLQNLYEIALVSPIYVVFSVNEGVDSYFLHRVLKLDSYRQQFKTATTSSVERRGSLRWPAFSAITVSIPPLSEQTAIATVLSDMEAEIAALEERRDKTKLLKQGMMQDLLTGKTRLI